MKQALKNILTLSFLWIVSSTTFAQTNILNARVPSEIGEKTTAQQESDNDVPLPYGYVDDRDIMWSTTTWELVDLEERANFPLLFPIDTMEIGADRRSLYDVLLRAMKEKKLTETPISQKRRAMTISNSACPKPIPSMLDMKSSTKDFLCLLNISYVPTLPQEILFNIVSKDFGTSIRDKENLSIAYSVLLP